MSYGVYLYHTIVIDQLNKLYGAGSTGWRYPSVTVTSLVLTVVCAGASYYLLERPMMLLGRGGRFGLRPAVGWRGRLRS